MAWILRRDLRTTGRKVYLETAVKDRSVGHTIRGTLNLIHAKQFKTEAEARRYAKNKGLLKQLVPERIGGR